MESSSKLLEQIAFITWPKIEKPMLVVMVNLLMSSIYLNLYKLIINNLN